VCFLARGGCRYVHSSTHLTGLPLPHRPQPFHQQRLTPPVPLQGRRLLPFPPPLALGAVLRFCCVWWGGGVLVTGSPIPSNHHHHLQTHKHTQNKQNKTTHPPLPLNALTPPRAPPRPPPAAGAWLHRARPLRRPLPTCRRPRTSGGGRGGRAPCVVLCWVGCFGGCGGVVV
jgi:hypothetical protein